MDLESLSDGELLQRYRKGEIDVFQFLVKRYLPLIYSFVLGYMKDADTAQDVTQEVFVKAWSHQKRFDLNKSFKVWLYTIAKNTSLDFLKKKKIATFSDLTEDETFLDVQDDAPVPDEILLQKENVNFIQQVLQKLPVRYREVIILYYHDGFNFREISEILKIPFNTVKSNYRRGLVMLKNEIEEHDGYKSKR